METEGRIGSKLKAYCSACRGERNCEIKGHHSERGEDGDGYYMWHRDWYLLTCCGCEHVFAQSVSTNSEDCYHQDLPNGAFETVYFETIESWPAKAKRARPDWFQGDVIESDLDTLELDASLRELYGALDHDLNVLASIGMRTSFDIASEILGIDPNKPFVKKIDDLVTKGLIRETEKDHIAVLVDAGSASAHRGWRPKVSDIDALMDTLEDFIFNNIVLPARKKVAAEKLAKVKAKVPQKSKAGGKSKKPPVSKAAGVLRSDGTPV